MPSEFLEYAAALHPEIEAELDAVLPAASEAPERLHAAMRYSVFAGGKRIRPILVVLAGEAFGAGRGELLPGAAALELIHTFSLVHDDLPALDDDDLRRGRPTVHREFGEATAVLVGDALLNLGLAIVASRPSGAPPERRLRAVAVVAEAVGTRGMIGGQMADLEAEGAWPEDPRTALEAIHRRKTGALLAASVRLGGIAGGASAAEDERLAELGHRLGLMFQIADDILDLEGSPDTLGKSARKDVAARKLTYPALYGLERSKQMLAAVRDEAVADVQRLPGRRELFASLIAYLSRRDR
jgi:geranylgeranyl diphosphate synthase type II